LLSWQTQARGRALVTLLLSFVYGVSVGDPLTYLASCVGVSGVGALAFGHDLRHNLQAMVGGMAFEMVGRVVIAVHTAQDPSDAEWSGYLALLSQVLQPSSCTFVYTSGGAPNSKQRKALAHTLRGRDLPISVVTPARVSRAVGVAISWFNPNIRMFSPGHISAAITHLKLTDREAVDVPRTARQLAKSLGIHRALLDLAELEQPRPTV
jgi:hypothetical protein